MMPKKEGPPTASRRRQRTGPRGRQACAGLVELSLLTPLSLACALSSSWRATRMPNSTPFSSSSCFRLSVSPNCSVTVSMVTRVFERKPA